MEFFLYNKRKKNLNWQYTKIQLSQKIGKILKLLITNSNFENWKLLYSTRTRIAWSTFCLVNLATFSPENTENITKFESWRLTLVAHKK